MRPRRLLVVFGIIVLCANGALLYSLFSDYRKQPQENVLNSLAIVRDNRRYVVDVTHPAVMTEIKHEPTRDRQRQRDADKKRPTITENVRKAAEVTGNRKPEVRVPRKESLRNESEAKIESKVEQMEGKQAVRVHSQSDDDVLPVLVLACDRTSVKRCLDLLIKYRPSVEHHPIIVSQDCGHAPTAAVIQSYGDQIKHIQQPDLSDIVMEGTAKNRLLQGYYKISRHYKWALTQVFDVMKFKAVVIVEDDLDIAGDFFEYFIATRRVLVKDPSLWCVSAWSDNGKQNFIDSSKPDLLYRSDFFPGLGWMLTSSLWDELRDKWPKAFWDDWMRDSAQRKGRACLRPEIPRTDTFGRVGVSRGQFFDKHLKFIVLNSQAVHFTEKDLSYLMKDEYDRHYLDDVYSVPLISAEQLHSGSIADNTVRVEYHSNNEFVQLAQRVGIMADLKDRVPRMAYKGVVSFMFHSHRVYLTRPQGQTEYYTDKPKIRVT